VLLINWVIDDALFNRNDTRHRSSAASVYQRHELARPAAAFLPNILYSTGFGSVMLGGERSAEMKAGSSVSFLDVDCLARSVSRNTALLETKELSTDLTHDTQ